MRSFLFCLLTTSLLLGAGCASEPERDGGNFKQCVRQCKVVPKKGNQRTYCHQACRDKYRGG